MQELSDEELDALVLTRLKLMGVDLGILPPDDPSAPADQRRILASARDFLRSTPRVIRDLPFGHEGVAPAAYPAAGVGARPLPEEG
jgi:hypothetical protein